MPKLLALVLACALASCAPAPETHDDTATAEPAGASNAPSSAPPAQLLTAEGTVVSVTAGEVTIEHEGVGDLWEPQSMPFPVADTALLDGLTPGTNVKFWVAIRDDDSYYLDMIERQ